MFGLWIEILEYQVIFLWLQAPTDITKPTSYGQRKSRDNNSTKKKIIMAIKILLNTSSLPKKLTTFVFFFSKFIVEY